MVQNDSTAKNSSISGLGVFAQDTDIILYFKSSDNSETTLHTATSPDGLALAESGKPLSIRVNKKLVDPAVVSSIHPVRIQNGYAATYTSRMNGGQNLYTAVSQDLFEFSRVQDSPLPFASGSIVPEFMHNGRYVMYCGTSSIYLASSNDLKTWKVEDLPVIESKNDHQGRLVLTVAGIFKTHEGIAVVYIAQNKENNGDHFSIHAALFEQSDPKKLIWVSDTIWEQNGEWKNRGITPLGIVYFQGKLISYWNDPSEGVFAIPHTALAHVIDQKSTPHVILSRHENNPIITPLTKHYWESKATFNPAAVYEGGKVHLLYRAIGDYDTSVLGYAASRDGFTIDERLSDPVYIPRQPFETPAFGKPITIPTSFESGGGGYGGCEDPRLTKVGDRMYLTYIAYDGVHPPRVALSSIAMSDFLGRVWNWDMPVLISKPHEVNKNCVLFPEKINGKYIILHRVYPHILIDAVDSLDFDGKTKFLKGEYRISPSRTSWDSRKIGAGPPPIKTPEGWLLVYHAVGEQDPSRYKMGAMLLDLQDPTKVLYRTTRPILAPEESYENNGFKAGVAYPCGAIEKDTNLIVYYGGSDSYVCAATAPMEDVLSGLINTGSASIHPVSIPKMAV